MGGSYDNPTYSIENIDNYTELEKILYCLYDFNSIYTFGTNKKIDIELGNNYYFSYYENDRTVIGKNSNNQVTDITIEPFSLSFDYNENGSLKEVIFDSRQYSAKYSYTYDEQLRLKNVICKKFVNDEEYDWFEKYYLYDSNYTDVVYKDYKYDYEMLTNTIEQLNSIHVSAYRFDKNGTQIAYAYGEVLEDASIIRNAYEDANGCIFIAKDSKDYNVTIDTILNEPEESNQREKEETFTVTKEMTGEKLVSLTKEYRDSLGNIYKKVVYYYS